MLFFNETVKRIPEGKDEQKKGSEPQFFLQVLNIGAAHRENCIVGVPDSGNILATLIMNEACNGMSIDNESFVYPEK